MPHANVSVNSRDSLAPISEGAIVLCDCVFHKTSLTIAEFKQS